MSQTQVWQCRLQMADPELVQLLSGSAPSALKLKAMDGTLSPVAPDALEVKEESRKREATALFNKGEALTLTERMRLQMIAPAAYGSSKTKPIIGKIEVSMNSMNRPVRVNFNRRERQAKTVIRGASSNGKVKVSAKPAPQTTVTYRGEREELQGRKFHIPSDVANKARFIEQEYDRQQQEEEAKAERERLDADAEAERPRSKRNSKTKHRTTSRSPLRHRCL